MEASKSGTCWVVVLGEIGRSPRMQYHTMSLLQESLLDVKVFAHMQNADGIRQEILHYKEAPLLHKFMQVKVAAWYERLMARRCSSAITVTQSFKSWLGNQWGVKAHVLHDKAPSFFKPTTPDQAHKLMVNMQAELQDQLHVGASFMAAQFGEGITPITARSSDGAGVTWRAQPRPYLLVSSTSWTPDEDFEVLLDAAKAWDSMHSEDASLPDIIIVVTGKGPDKAQYLQRLKAVTLRHVALRTAWLSPQDYNTLLAAADLAVSLHASSSDLDLPMKVADMLGSGTPVCAYRFACASEQVEEGCHGHLFSTASELASIWGKLLVGQQQPSNHPRGYSKALAQLEGSVLADRVTWEESWRSVMPYVIVNQVPSVAKDFTLPKM